MKWKSEISVEFAGQEIKADFEIDTPELIITLQEENLWSSFINILQEYTQLFQLEQQWEQLYFLKRKKMTKEGKTP